MITFAWDITDEMLVGAPRWVDTARFDILAKASSDSPTSEPGATPMDLDDLRLTMRKLQANRFKLVAHMENRPLDAYTLLAGNPKLRRADPANRTGCKEGLGTDGKDPRVANPILGRLLTCQSMTVAQFAAKLQSQAPGYFCTPVLNSIRIGGAYDLTLGFSSLGQV
jgi:uncharacterized protein (TIGR03435 family)